MGKFAALGTVNVNANANRRAISPLIYDANWADGAKLSNLNMPVNRRRSNATTTYNWQVNATKAGGAGSLITIPLVDWFAKPGAC